jgi:UDP-N-acetyl-D-mannosaminuronate dehydrogenase/intein/homing endonuclease
MNRDRSPSLTRASAPLGPAAEVADELREKIETRQALVGVIGLGYVGLPLSLVFVDRGFRVVGFDVDRRKIESLAARRSYIPHIEEARIAEGMDSGRFEATADFDRLDEPDAILICVPTPLTPQREPDMTFVEATTRSIAASLRAGQLVVLESTTYPGTTEELVKPLLEEGGLACGVDFFLAFSPEREDPGNPRHTTSTIPKVVGGVDPVSGDLAEALYASVVLRTVRVSSARVAEATKLTENVFRAVNIALVNELKLVYERMGIDIWEVLDASSTKPFGFMRFNPGPGWGGHCVDGEEFVFVKRKSGITAVRMRELAAGHYREVGDIEVMPLDDVEILSFDLERGKTCFRRATHLFRRWFPDRVTLRTPEGRTLTTTDGHPMVVETGPSFDVRRADAIGEGRPVVALELPETGAVEPVDLVAVLGLDGTSKVRAMPRRGSWLEDWEPIRSTVRRGGIERKDLARSNTLPLGIYLDLERQGVAPFRRQELHLTTGNGAAQSRVPWIFDLDADFARLIGYYLSEGCLTHDRSWRTRWCFGAQEVELIDDVIGILTRLRIRWSIHRVKRWRAVQIKVSSNLFGALLRDGLDCGVRSEEMRVPPMFMSAPEAIRRELLGALLNGDGSVDARRGPVTYRRNGRTYRHRCNTAHVSYFTSSPKLFQEVLLLLHSLRFTPTIGRSGRELRLYGEEQLRRLRPLLRGAKGEKLDDYFDGRSRPAKGRKMYVRTGFASTAAPEVRATEGGWVYSLEVPGTQTYVTSFGLVSHNCIPLDPFYLAWKARQYGKSTRFIELAGEINTQMPEHVIERVVEALNVSRLPVHGSRILVLGLSYKPDVGDDRESPSYQLMDLLDDRGAEIAYHDPYIPRIGPSREHGRWEGLESVSWDEGTIRSFDVVVISTDHAAVDYGQLAVWARRIVDTRNAMAKVPVDPDRLWKA